MKPGDLRRFSDKLVGSPSVGDVAGRPLMVLEVGETPKTSMVSFLIDGRIERGWGGDWVESNSEVVDESR